MLSPAAGAVRPQSQAVSLWQSALSALPSGGSLPEASWKQRHRAILAILWAHVPGLFLFAVLMGVGIGHGLLEIAPVTFLAVIAGLPWLPRRYRAMCASVGLIVCSAIMVHLSGGFIEMHFHFFVMVIVISLYEDWLPLLVAIAFVVLHHGSVGVAEASAVYRNPEAVAHPWRWAGIHGAFVLAASAASVVSWRLNERARGKTELLLQSVGEGICGLDARGHITFANDAAERMLGVPAATLVGMPMHRAVHGHAPTGSRAHSDESCFAANGRTAAAESAEDTFFAAGGQSFPVERTVTTLRDGGHGEGTVVVFQDITERKKYEERLSHQAMFDDLTGLPNRRLFADRLSHAVARSLVLGESVAVLYLDLDRFKLVNDTLGHQSGDTLLIAFARELRAVVPRSETVARLGGDEFAVLLEGVGQAAPLDEMVQQILVNTARPFPVGDRDLGVKVSIGIAVSSNERRYHVPDDLLRDADVAMYHAKANGGGEAVWFEPHMNDAARLRLELEADLRGAAARKEFHLEYQPEIELGGNRIVGVEALIRWDHPRLGVLQPGSFIPVAEETGALVEIGRWALAEACRQLRAWSDATGIRPGEDLVMSVNLSMRELRQPGIVDYVAEQLELNRLPSSCLKVEITESEMMLDAHTTIAVLNAFKDLGVHLAIDDFGTGYSSLSYLRQFPVRTLKIDRSFIASLREEGTLPILRAIMALARALDVDVTAEGIETGEQLDAVKALGCHRAQGFHFARSLHPAALQALLTTGVQEQAA